MQKWFKPKKPRLVYTSLVALLAQLAEQLTLNQRVASSSLAQGIELLGSGLQKQSEALRRDLILSNSEYPVCRGVATAT